MVPFTLFLKTLPGAIRAIPPRPFPKIRLCDWLQNPIRHKISSSGDRHMKRLFILSLLTIFNVTFGITLSFAGGPNVPHVSGSAHPQSSPTVISHISGAHKGQNPATIQNHISGTEQPKVIPPKPKKRSISSITKVLAKKSSSDRISARKTCWARCQSIWQSSVTRECSADGKEMNKPCRKKYFQERLSCVRENCSKIK